MQANDIKSLITLLIKSIEQEDYPTLRKLYADDVENYVTDKEGGSFLVKGCENYLAAIKRMNFSSVHPSLTITQINVLSEDTALFMIEVKAQKPTKTLHNFSAYLVEFANNKIKRTTMVEALPAYSDSFWNES